MYPWGSVPLSPLVDYDVPTSTTPQMQLSQHRVEPEQRIWRTAAGSVVDEARRIVHAVINTKSIDSYDTVVMPRGVRLERFRKNPQVLWNHDINWPIGRGLVDTISVTEDRIELDYQFYDFSNVPHRGPLAGLVEDLWHLVKNSNLIGYSVGFMPLRVSESKTEDGTPVVVYDEWELFEFSLTPIPANPDTLAKAPTDVVQRYLQSLARTQDPVQFYTFVEKLPEQVKRHRRLIHKAKRLSFEAIQYREVQKFLEELYRREPEFAIQTLIFDKAVFTLQEAHQWCEDHGFRHDKVDETENSYRFRQFDPEACQRDSFRTFEITEGVQAVGCKRVDETHGPAEVQNASSVRVNPQGVSHARKLIAQGDVDMESDWEFTAEDGNKLLGPNGDDWDNYAKYHLAIHTDAPENTKERYGFPYGKNGKVYRRGVIAAKQRAAQMGYTNIMDVADQLLQEIDKKTEEEHLSDGGLANQTALLQEIASLRDAIQRMAAAVQELTQKVDSIRSCPECPQAKEKIAALEASLAAEKERVVLFAQALRTLYQQQER